MTRTTLALLVATAVAATGCMDAWSTPTVKVGSRAPHYEAVTLEGESVALADLRGEVVLLNVWATWCYPCRREMPSLQALQDELGEAGLHVVAVSVDRAGDAGEIEDFLLEHGIRFTVLHDPDHDIAGTFRTRGLPETYLIDRDGIVTRHWIGMIDGRSESVRAPVFAALAGRPYAPPRVR
jgi:cytochrome c biogenesis protein CcmG, thiol:disulfide interchange protein DsbE